MTPKQHTLNWSTLPKGRAFAPKLRYSGRPGGREYFVQRTSRSGREPRTSPLRREPGQDRGSKGGEAPLGSTVATFPLHGAESSASTVANLISALRSLAWDTGVRAIPAQAMTAATTATTIAMVRTTARRAGTTPP